MNAGGLGWLTGKRSELRIESMDVTLSAANSEFGGGTNVNNVMLGNWVWTGIFPRWQFFGTARVYQRPMQAGETDNDYNQLSCVWGAA